MESNYNNLQNFIYIFEKIVWSFPLVALLVSMHLYFTFKLKFPQKNIISGLKHMLFQNRKNESDGISSYKALMTVLAGMLGMGNIIGVSTAIIVGSIGSIFWIFVSGIIAIATKYAETYIVIKYRKKDKSGTYGGAMYVISERLDNKTVAIIFSVLIIFASFGIGAMIQSNSIVNGITEIFNINKKVIALVITILASYIIFGNEKRISNISSLLVPVSTFIYLGMCFLILIKFREFLCPCVIRIIKESFNVKSAAGGIFSTAMIISMVTGLSRGLFSNEAGMGSSPIFDATVNEKNIKKQSIISSTSVFIDTVFICTLTGLVLVITSSYLVTSNPIEMSNFAFSKIPYGQYLLTFCLVIFGFATIPCWGYYGHAGIKFLFKSSNFYMILYKIIYIIAIYLGGIFTLDIVWSVSSIANGLMVFENAYMLFKLRNEIES